MKLIAPCGVIPLCEDKVVAIDLDSRYLVKSRAKSSDTVRYVIGDLNHLPFQSQSFAHINCWNVLEHLGTKAQVMSEISRVSEPGAYLDFSAGIRAGDQFLGRLSKNYNQIVTQNFHQWTAPSAEYIKLVEQDYVIEHIEYPCAATVIIFVALADILDLTVNDAAEWQGRGKSLAVAHLIAGHLGRFLQPLFNLLKRNEYWRELLSQTVIIQAKRKEQII
ncbi:MAG: class I SAM-dependent methyltransferase [Anaerolineae bacterium]|nr:class I SAM-dependent methyltransferase [Anaerolineae bacterium]